MTSIARALTASLVALGLLAPLVCEAKGTVRVQQANGDVQIYDNATIRIVGKTLRITTADGKGTIVITDAACSYVGKLMRCLPYHYVLQQGGTHQLDFEHGTIYYNPTQTSQQMSYSSQMLEPGGVLIAVKSKKGTYLSVTGKLDGRSP
jgi:hypothetical protein